MKTRKNKGSISIVILIMMLLLISIGLVFYDLTRLSTSREHIDRSLVNAMDSALVEYDENLYSKYNVMALSKDINASDIIKQRIDIILNRKNVKKDSSSYHLIGVVSVQGGKLSKEKAIKRAILRSHQKKFVVNKVSEWIDKLEILEMIPEYAKSMKLYAKSIKVVAKLKNTYDDLREKSEKIAKKYTVVKGINIKDCVNTIIDIKEEIDELKKEKKELQDEKSDLLSSTNNKKEILDELSSINSDIRAIKDEISDLKSLLEEFEDKIEEVKELGQKIETYSKKLSNFCSDIQDKASDLRKDINEIDFSKNEKMQTIMNKISEVLLKVEKASEKISTISKTVEKVSSEVNKQIRKIEKHLKNAEKMYEEVAIAFDNIDEISSDNLIAIFGDKNIMPSSSMDIIIDFIWESIAGDYLPAFDNLSDLELEGIENLPSSMNCQTDSLESKQNKPNSKYDIVDDSLATYENSADKHTNSEIGKKTNEFFQKLIIADYVVSTFSNINQSKIKEGSKDFKAEVEYILSGNKSSKENVLITQSKIYSLRMVFNGISILMHKQLEINELATSLSSVTGFLGYPLAYGLVCLGWGAIESAQDIKTLNAGGSVPILKMKTELKTDITNIVKNASMETFKDSIKKSAKEMLKSSKKDEVIDLANKNPLSMDYEDHLMLFLVLEDETETLLRISDLICLKENVNTNNYYTALHSKIMVEIPVIFKNAKNKFTQDGKSSYIYESEKVRGY